MDDQYTSYTTRVHAFYNTFNISAPNLDIPYIHIALLVVPFQTLGPYLVSIRLLVLTLGKPTSQVISSFFTTSFGS